MLVEGIFLWSAIVFYLLGFMLLLVGVIFKKDKLLSYGWILAVLGFLSHNLTIIVRWIESGHAPFYGTYEHFIAQSWFFVAIYFVVATKRVPVRSLGIGILPFSVLLMGYGIMSGHLGVEPLPPPYRSLWLWVHAVSWFGYGAFFIACISSIIFLIKEKGGRGLPELNTLDLMTFRMIIFGFVTLTIGMGAGAIWAYGLWGRYWAWDPIETWTLITWLVYGLNIHLKVSYGWNGKKAAWLAIASLTSTIITLGGVGFVGGVHTTLLK